jgi:hypothetical protein
VIARGGPGWAAGPPVRANTPLPATEAAR